MHILWYRPFNLYYISNTFSEFLHMLWFNLRDYEPDPSFNPSLAQLLWCEKNLKQSLHRLNDKKVNHVTPQNYVDLLLINYSLINFKNKVKSILLIKIN